MTGTQIDEAYNQLFSSIDREMRRLKQVLTEQQMKSEGERLKKIQVKPETNLGKKIDFIFFSSQSELEGEKRKNLSEEQMSEQEREESRQ